MLDQSEAIAFVRRNTTLTSPPLVPEVLLHLATEVTPLWHATAKELDRYDALPFWAFAWPGGQALARFVLDEPAVVASKRVFDFAAGSGLEAIAALRAGAQSAVACDHDPFAAVAMHLNAAANRVTLAVSHDDVLGKDLDDVDVVLAGDIFYEQPLAERGLAWLQRLVRERGVVALVADAGRVYSPSGGLAPLMSYVVPASRELEDGETRTAVVSRVLA